MAAGGGGAWKVAYADFVTAMMAFFLVMWITGQSKPVKQAVAKYFEDPLGVKKGARSTSLKGPHDSITIGPFESGRGPARGLAMADLRTNAPPNPRGVSAITPPKVILFRHQNRTHSVGTVVLFPEGSAELNDAALQRLRDLVPNLLGKINKVEIRVYSSRSSTQGTAETAEELRLSFERCQTLRNYLIEKGIEPDRIRLTQDGQIENYTPHPKAGEELSNGYVEVFATDEYRQ